MKEEKRDKIVAVRLRPTQYAQVRELVKTKYLTPSTLGRILIEKFIQREVQI
jgi:hypothetical protein